MARKFSMESYNRRELLQYAGAGSVAGLTALAGCMGEDSGNGNGGNGNGNGGNGNGNGGNGGNGGSDYPSDDIRYIIPFSEGGGTDTYARQMVPLVDERLEGGNIAMENISGAASMRGTGEMMLSEPDGYTLAAFNPPSTPVSEMVNPQDFPLEEATGVCSYARTLFVIVANPEHEIEGYDDLMDRYADGDLENFSGKERGGVDHVMAILMQNLHGLDWDQYVGYDGSGPAVQATISGEVPAAISTDTAAEPAVEGGDVDIVTCLVSDGTPVFPDTDSITDLGYDNIDFISQLQRCIYAPPDTPREPLDTFASAVEETLQTDEMQEWSDETGNIIEYGSYEDAEEALQEGYETIPENVDLEEVREAAN